jgi:hypothetical protein
MKKQIDTVTLVYKQTDLNSFEVIKAFRDEKEAERFCTNQNDLNLPEFDDYGYCEGVYHNFFTMKVE